MGWKFQEADYDRMVVLYQAGQSCRDVAAQMGGSPGLVSRVLRGRGVSMRPAGSLPGDRRGLRKCSKCGEEKPHTAFNKSPSSQTKDGLFVWCKRCQRAYSKKYAEEHRDQVNERRRRHRKTNPWPYAAASQIKADVKRGHQTFPSQEERTQAIRSLTQFLAAYPEKTACGVEGCGEPATEWDEIRYGEGHRPGNVGRLCRRHNRIKRDALLEDLEGLARYIREGGKHPSLPTER